MKKFVTWLTVVIILVIVVFFYFRFFFVYRDGISAGQLNYFAHSGVMFKTYEGKLIQAGFGSKTAGALQSNEFRFSVVDTGVASKLDRAGSKIVELHYKQYFGSLPWRGDSRFIVDSVISVSGSGGASSFPQ